MRKSTHFIEEIKITRKMLIESFKDLNLYDKHPNIFKTINPTVRCFINKFEPGSSYHQFLYNMTTNCINYNKGDRKQFLIKYSDMNSIYLQHDMNKFRSTKFIVDFCGQSIEHIMVAFKFFNFKSMLSSIVTTNTEFMEIMSKSYDMYLITNLANVFSYLHFLSGIGCLGLHNKMYHVGDSIILLDIISGTNNLTTCDELCEKYPEPTLFLSKICGNKQKLFKIIKSVRELISPVKYISALNLANDLDFLSICGKKGINAIKHEYLHRMTDNFFKYYLLRELLIEKNIVCDVKFEPQFPIPKLEIPDLTTDIKINKYIEI